MIYYFNLVIPLFIFETHLSSFGGTYLSGVLIDQPFRMSSELFTFIVHLVVRCGTALIYLCLQSNDFQNQE